MSRVLREQLRTRDGGTLALEALTAAETPALARCATCGEPIHGAADGELGNALGLDYTGPSDRRLTTTLCGGCVAEALAVWFGRAHVRDGGDVSDLSYEP